MDRSKHINHIVVCVFPFPLVRPLLFSLRMINEMSVLLAWTLNSCGLAVKRFTASQNIRISDKMCAPQIHRSNHLNYCLSQNDHLLTWILRLTCRPQFEWSRSLHLRNIFLFCFVEKQSWVKANWERRIDVIFNVLVWLWLKSPPIRSELLLLLANSADSLLLELLFTCIKLILFKLTLPRFDANLITSAALFNDWSLSWK